MGLELDEFWAVEDAAPGLRSLDGVASRGPAAFAH